MSAARNARSRWKAVVRNYVKPGRAVRIQVRHDPDCTIYGPAPVCTCNPDRVILDAQGRVLAEVDGLGPFDPMEVLS